MFASEKIVDLDTALGRCEVDHLPKTLDSVVSQKVQTIVVNLSRVRYINCASIGILVGVMKRLRKKGGSLKVYVLADNVKHVFDLRGVSAFLEIYDSEDSALAQSKNSE